MDHSDSSYGAFPMMSQGANWTEIVKAPGMAEIGSAITNQVEEL